MLDRRGGAVEEARPEQSGAVPARSLFATGHCSGALSVPAAARRQQHDACWCTQCSSVAAMPTAFAQLVVGPPGAGKTTFCHGMQQFLTALGRYATCPLPWRTPARSPVAAAAIAPAQTHARARAARSPW